jgi:hypothetical protein
MIDHASLFTEIVHCYLPKLYITIYQSCTLLFTNYRTLLFTDYNIWVDSKHPLILLMIKC